MSDDLQPAQSTFSRCATSRYQLVLDKLTPYPAIRWGGTVLFGFIYILRIIQLQGFYIVTYALGIYHLNLFIAFLTPKIDPAFDFDSDDDDDESGLPTRQNDEFRPFMRRLPEFKFWYSATKAIFVASICTCFEVFNIPVFWPILVIYFIVLFMLTMKRQIRIALTFSILGTCVVSWWTVELGKLASWIQHC